ncbi:MAG: hypothetical protein C0475_04980 [Planctomyces sp.]|nr:hypothetical protein [Planctomyces sp.]MBA4038761.1 hypothetical protein [Planctomyces sp.]MBA4120148.1 hypothetical protein [Isosphaera sp.]
MPARFVFTLEPVLDMRRRDEERCLRQVAELERQRLQITERVGSVQRGAAGDRQRLTAAMSPGTVDMAVVRMQAVASQHAVLRLQRAAIELAGVMHRIEAARLALQRATAARKALEIMRQKQRVAWARQQAQRETLEHEDLAVMRFGREPR